MASAEKTENSPAGQEEFFIRFSLRQCLEHWGAMTLFIILVVTGLPQKYFTASWAQTIVATLGGIDFTRFIHRMAGIALSALLVNHLAYLGFGLITGKSGLSMIPSRKDASDAIAMLKYCLGASDTMPSFGRFDYRQKFEYWGLLFGLFIMILTGFILYFPTWTTMILPGQVVPAAKMAHTNEAMLALLTIVTWHLYGAHLNPDVFPFDTSIFTRRISRERMLKEHPLELEEIIEKEFEEKASAEKADVAGLAVEESEASR